MRLCDHIPIQPEICYLCRLCASNAEYRAFYCPELPPLPKGTSSLPSPSPLLGDVVESALSAVGITKERVERFVGGPCGCQERQERLNNLHRWANRVLSKLFGSSEEAEHGLRQLTGEAGGPVRHLAYHVWPRRATEDIWRWNLEQLVRRWPVFTGRKVIGVALDGGTNTLEDVQQAIGKAGVEWLTVENNQYLRETATWLPLWERLAGTTGITFYGHAKGVRHGPHSGVRRWTEIMYDVCLDYPGVADEQLRQHLITGCFKTGGGIRYDGTYFWVRNDAALERCGRAKQSWNGVECWPSETFTHEQSAVMFFDVKSGGMNLYSAEYIAEHVEGRLKRWKQDKAAFRSAIG